MTYGRSRALEETGFVPFHGSGPLFCSKADMAGILIIAHAPFATALRDCISHIYGGLPARIGVIDVSPDCDPAQMVAFANSEIERLKEENGALVLTDMFGATPANIAGRLATMPNVRVLCGVNLPMLVRAVCYRATPLDTLVDKALAGATKGVHAIGPATPAPVASTAACGDCLPALPPEAAADTCVPALPEDADLTQKADSAGL
jgi:PTS system ascorbate-specific IIA component